MNPQKQIDANLKNIERFKSNNTVFLVEYSKIAECGEFL